MKPKKERAAILPYYVDGNEIKFLFALPSDPKYGGGPVEGLKYQLGKGEIDSGESPESAAVREGNEELGLQPNNIEEIVSLGTFLKTMHVFIAKIKDPGQFSKPHFETKDTKWMTAKEFGQSGREIHKIPVYVADKRIRKMLVGDKPTLQEFLNQGKE